MKNMRAVLPRWWRYRRCLLHLNPPHTYTCRTQHTTPGYRPVWRQRSRARHPSNNCTVNTFARMDVERSAAGNGEVNNSFVPFSAANRSRSPSYHHGRYFSETEERCRGWSMATPSSTELTRESSAHPHLARVQCNKVHPTGRPTD